MGIRPPVMVIAGPTASGKSALALKLAEQTRGVVVNADSAQLYRDLPILSAAPSGDDLARAEHRLYGVLDGATSCSAADWAAMARREIADIHAKGNLPILVGGTGLYLRTLFEGIAPVPAISRDVRSRVRSTSVDINRSELAKLDPETAGRLHPADTARIARALEVVLSTGRTLSDWQRQRDGGIRGQVELRAQILLPPRDWLYERCDRRFERMMHDGAVEEVAAILSRQLNLTLPVMRAIGVPELSALIRGEMTRNEAIAAGQQATRRYAKRQYTWFEHQPPPDWQRLREPSARLGRLALFASTA